MKFLCAACDEPMKLQGVEGPKEGSLTITFVCPRCYHGISLLTNPGETQLVRALGVKIGGPGPSSPFEVLAQNLASGLPWTGEAQAKLSRVPPFAQAMARQAIESFARAKGYPEITPQVVDEARSAWDQGSGP